MARVAATLLVKAPRERAFDLARSMDVHQASMQAHQESVVAGVTEGLMGPGDCVTFRARHFGVWQELTSCITVYERPTMFQDEMTEGIFASLIHTHTFELHESGTLMHDVFVYEVPFGWVGRLANRLFLSSYLRKLLQARQRAIKEVAESDSWHQYI